MTKGSATEDLILGVNTVYLHEERGRIVKREPATKWSRKKRGPIYVGQGAADFSAVYRGRSVEIEAKEVSKGKRLAFNNPDKFRKQIYWLEEHARGSGLSFMLIHFCDSSKDLREAYLCPVVKMTKQSRKICPFLGWAFYELGHVKSIPLKWFRGNAIRVYERNGGLDWGLAIDLMLRGEEAKSGS